MRIAVAGSGHLGVSLLNPLARSGHEIVALIQNGRETKGWRRQAATAAARSLGGRHNLLGRAQRLGIPVFWLDQMTDEALAPLRAMKLDLILVGGFSIIFKRSLLDLPRIGVVNVHSSLLPRHRGPNPFAQCVLQGDEESGVTFHVMTEGIDEGDILDQTPFPIDADDTLLSVYHRSCELTEQRVIEVIDRIAREGLRGTPQDHSKATYEPKIKDEDAWIDWTRSAVEIDRFVRGLAPSIMPCMRYEGQTIKVAKIDYTTESAGMPPGTIVANNPMVCIATGAGIVRLRVALTARPVVWVWPSPWSRPPLKSTVDLVPPGPTLASVWPAPARQP